MCCADTDAAKDGSLTKEGKPPPGFWLCVLLVALSSVQDDAECLCFVNGCNFPVSVD